MRSMLDDLRFAARALRARPAFSAMVVLTLGLGLGATTAMFAVVDAVMLRPLPYPDDHALVRIVEREASRNLTGVSIPALHDWSAFPEIARLAGHEAQPLVFTQGGAPERVSGVAVSPAFFATLGVDALIGEALGPSVQMFDPVRRLVLGHDLWQRHFGGDEAVVGQPVILEGRQYDVAGVMPPGFSYPSGAEFWRTLPVEMAQVAEARQLRFLDVVARLAPGADLDELRERLTAWKSAHPDADEPWVVSAQSLRAEARGGVGPALATVFVGVGLLLLVACANVMALLLASGRAREPELAMRGALGATRGRLVRQLVVEGAMLALAGAGIAIVVTRATRTLIVELSADQIPRIAGIGVGTSVVVFAVAAGLVSALLVALWPAWSLTRTAIGPGVMRGTRTVAGSRRGRAWFGALVAAEFALALVLVAGAGLLLGSYRQLAAVDSGASAARVGTASIVLPLTPEWRARERGYALARDLTARVRSIPGVQGAAMVSRLPLAEARGGVDIAPVGQPEAGRRALLTSATPGYFETVGAALVAGRDFSDADHDAADAVVVLNEVAATLLFGSAREAIDRRLSYDFMLGTEEARVVGVVRPVRYNGLTAALAPELIVPAAQSVLLPTTLVYRAAGDPVPLVAAVRAALAASDPTASAVLSSASTLDDLRASQVARPRFFLVLAGVFAVMAFALAGCGVYGTTAYWLAESRREMGIRLALGASPRQLVALLASRGGRVAAGGTALGLGLALAGNRFMAHLLFGVEPTDPATLAASAAILLVGGGLGSVLPARRVMHIAASATMRSE